MESPAFHAYLNQIKNFWGTFKCWFYLQGKQYMSKEDFWITNKIAAANDRASEINKVAETAIEKTKEFSRNKDLRRNINRVVQCLNIFNWFVFQEKSYLIIFRS